MQEVRMACRPMYANQCTWKSNHNRSILGLGLDLAEGNFISKNVLR